MPLRLIKRGIFSIALIFTAECPLAATPQNSLEEVIVTAQKREQSLQDVPIAVSVIDSKQLQATGISSIDALGRGIVPSLNAHSYGNSNSIQVLTIRGNGNANLAPVTTDPTVAPYIDGFYLGRSQGLSLNITDPERIEVLRGPQGALFGRNAVGGAINIISKRPTGNFGIDQTIGFGSNEQRKSITRINLPEFWGAKTKLDYIIDNNDGWVTNSAHGENNYDAYRKKGTRFALTDSLTDSISFNYFFFLAAHYPIGESRNDQSSAELSKRRRERFDSSYGKSICPR